MLSDGDSVAFNAVAELSPYGPDRPVQKKECVNHVHKRMGTALRKASKDGGLGGRGAGKLTADKCTRLQNYYRGAVLNNLDSEERMREAIWATFFHCASNDEDPHHGRCPDGLSSWCFFKAALARGERPGPHADHCGTAINRSVSNALVPLYKRFSSSALLKRVLHGKTQNANESVNNLIWVHCPKGRFVGKRRLQAAVYQAVCKFNRGNLQLAEVLESLNIPATEASLTFLQKADERRMKKADAAAEKQFQADRRARRVARQLNLAHQEDREGGTYGQGMMMDQ